MVTRPKSVKCIESSDKNIIVGTVYPIINWRWGFAEIKADREYLLEKVTDTQYIIIANNGIDRYARIATFNAE